MPAPLRRITAVIEVVYPLADTRTDGELAEHTRVALASGVALTDGRLAAWALTGTFTDPAAEPVAEDVVPAPPAAPED